MKTTTKKQAAERMYVGMDVGGTKIQASLVTEAGVVLSRHRQATPRGCSPQVTVDTIADTIQNLLVSVDRSNMTPITAVGIAVPGVVEPETGNVVVTPNMNLTQIPLGSVLRERLKVPVAVGNDCNLGTLGESWLGSGREAKSCVGIFVGTGIGSGIVIDGRLFCGAGQVAGEIGHLVTVLPCKDWRKILWKKKDKEKKEKKKDKDKNKEKNTGMCACVQDRESKHLHVCGCGNVGCFETMASRTAIERFLREAIAAGAKTDILNHCNGDLSVIKSGAIRKSLKSGDKVVTTIVQYVSKVIGYTCLSIRHFFDPEVIVLGGGVLEACSAEMMPIIESVMAEDKLPSAPCRRRVVLSSLGDDAVVLGAVALARIEAGYSPF